jgi:hypothetical protein
MHKNINEDAEVYREIDHPSPLRRLKFVGIVGSEIRQMHIGKSGTSVGSHSPHKGHGEVNDR